ncbi:acetyltransferase [Halobacteriovorax sp. XZX-3]|uniref:acetyltransferase n=1 Tax=unclassified Halobacteriovorax TaxID=2639665 RepID=UPI003719259E
MIKNKIIIFGLRDIAELAHYYLSAESDVEVVAFTVHGKFLDRSNWKGLPVIPYEEIENTYPVDEYKLFVPMTGSRMNRDRKDVYLQGKEKGYGFYSYISPFATVLTNRIGENCFILEDNTIQPFVEIGDNVVMWSGNHIGHHSRIGDHVFFTSHVVLSGHCNVHDFSWFGVNSTISNDVSIGAGTLVAMGSLVTKGTEEWGLYMGSPAKYIKSSEDINV